MMAVALLASPICSLLWKFSELATQEADEGNRQGQQTATSDTSPGNRDTHMTQISSSHHHGQPQSSLLDLGASADSSDLVSRVLARDYYDTAPWLWPCIIQAYLMAFATSGVTLITVNVSGGDIEMFEFWISGYHMLPYLVLGLPAACAASMTVGLHLDYGYDCSSARKWNRQFWIGNFIHAFYFLVFFDSFLFSDIWFYPPYITVPLSLYGICVCGGYLVLLGKEIKSRWVGSLKLGILRNKPRFN